MKREKRLQIGLLVLGILLGLIGQAMYDLFKIWLTPILIERRLLGYEDTMRSLVSVIAVGFAVLVLFLLFRKTLMKELES